MALCDLTDWLDDQSRPDRIWFLKRLSANDTGQSGGHQVGFYLPKPMVFDLFPSMNVQQPTENLDAFFTIWIDSHVQYADARVIWYNNRYWQQPKPKHPRDEMRVTRLGGTVYQDHDSTGTLTLLSFARANGNAVECHAWVCDNSIEEDLIEERTGLVDPGTSLVWDPTQMRKSDLFAPEPYRHSCFLAPEELPAGWTGSYPKGLEIVEHAVHLRPDAQLPPDKRLMRRRKCEYELFRSIEAAIELPVIQAGFQSIDSFVSHAQTVLQRRKSRSGRSLELHARAIMLEEGLVEGTDFEWQAVTEQGNTPDFLFPSAQAYHQEVWPSGRLRMLAAKTTCKDRWRQIAREAERIPVKHLLTLQEGVSENQFRQMADGGVQLVVPNELIDKYPKSVRPHLVTFESFITDVRFLACY